MRLPKSLPFAAFAGTGSDSCRRKYNPWVNRTNGPAAALQGVPPSVIIRT